MIKLKEIEIDGVHGMHSSYDLTDKTCFVGKNGVGKSTVLKSIQWALLGYIPGTNKTNAATFQHAVGRYMSVNLKLEVDGTDVSIFRQLTKSGTSIASVFEVEPKTYTGRIQDIISTIELPIFNFGEFANLTANKLKDWFINYLPKSEVAVNWEDFVNRTLADAHAPLPDKDTKDYLMSDIYELSASFEGIELIRKVNEMLKSQISRINADSKRIASTLQSLVIFDDDEEMSLVDTKIALSTAQRNRERIVKCHQAEAHNSEVFTKLCEFNLPARSADEDSQVLDLRDGIKNLYARKSDIKQLIDNIRTSIEVVKARREDSERMLSGTCPMFPDVECPHILQVKETAQLTKLELGKQLNELRKERDERKEQLEDICRGLEHLQNQHDAIVKQYEERECINRMYVTLPDLSDIEPTCDLEYWDREIDRLNRRIGQLENNALFSKLQDEKFKVDSVLEAYKALEKATGVNGLQSQLDSPFAKLVDMMNEDVDRLMGEEECSAEFLVSEKANSFSFGIRRNDLYIPYDMLSSGEKTLYCLALLAALCRLNPDIRLMLIDDLFDYLDKENYAEAIDWINHTDDIQFIFATVRLYSDTGSIHCHAVYNRSDGR